MRDDDWHRQEAEHVFGRGSYTREEWTWLIVTLVIIVAILGPLWWLL